MRKRFFRPFWSYDVVKTEYWLNRMSMSGLRLNNVNFKTRFFSFETAAPESLIHRVIYQKGFGGNVPPGLLAAGWGSAVSGGNFSIIRHDAGADPTLNPSYAGLLVRNRRLKQIIGILLAVLLGMFCAMVTANILIIALLTSIAGPATFVADDGPTAVQILQICLIVAAVLLTFAWMIFTYFRLRKANSQLERLCGDNLNLNVPATQDILLPRREEKRLLRSKKLVRKHRRDWTYEPDKTEQWLEAMEKKGLNLYRLSPTGLTFYFWKLGPRRMKYTVDYQNQAPDAYFTLNRDAGWKLIYRGGRRFMETSIWVHEIPPDSPAPQFYSDAESRLKQVRRFIVANFLGLLLPSLMFIFVLCENVFLLNTLDPLNILSLLLMIFLILQLVFSLSRIIRYYFRIKKN